MTGYVLIEKEAGGANGARAMALSALLWCIYSGHTDAILARTLTWENIGPGGGGAILSVAMDPQDFNTIHVGADLGGYFKSTDGGQTFRILSTGLTDYYVARILVDPTTNDVIYIGTLSGVFKSIDGGTSWAPKRNGFPAPLKYKHSAPISALLMDPTDARTIYAGVGLTGKMTGGRGHIYKTVDGAESWELLDGLAREAADAVICQLAIRYDGLGVLFAATDQGIFRSADAGRTWEPRNEGLPHLFCRDVAIHPLESDVMYAVMWTTPSQKPWRGGVYRSDNGGRTWAERNEGLVQHVAPAGSARQMTTNYSCLALDPQDPEHLYVGSDSWWGAGLYESLDGGRNWRLCTATSVADPNTEAGWVSFWGAAINCVSISPLHRDTLTFGDAGRLMRTDDGGRHWRQLYTRALPQNRWQGNGLEVTCLSEITIDPFRQGKMYCGYADIGLMVSDDEAQSWRQSVSGLAATGDMARVVCDPRQESVAWCCEGKPGGPQGGVAVTRDGGATWDVTGSKRSGLPEGPARFLVLDVDSPVEARTLYVVSYGNGVYKSPDGGRAWDALNEGFDQQRIHISDVVLDPSNSRRLFAAKRWSEGDPLGGLYVMDEGADRWRKTNRNIELPDIKSIAIDPQHPQVMFVGCHEVYNEALKQMFPGGIFRSEDGGQTWEQVLDDRSATCVRISASGPRIIYAATARYPYHDNAVGHGVLVSHDGGDTWIEANEGLANKNAIVITLDPYDPTRLYLGTGGNGLFVGRWEW